MDYLPMAKPVSQITTRGSAMTVACLFRRCRSLVVLTEGHDPCLYKRTGRSVFEFCEIEGQGGLIVDRETCLYAPGRKVDLRLWSHFIGSKVSSFEPVDELRPSENTREGASSAALRRFTAFRIVVTWLILPVVICLSQRLSHACLSINKFVL